MLLCCECATTRKIRPPTHPPNRPPTCINGPQLSRQVACVALQQPSGQARRVSSQPAASKSGSQPLAAPRASNFRAALNCEHPTYSTGRRAGPKPHLLEAHSLPVHLLWHHCHPLSCDVCLLHCAIPHPPPLTHRLQHGQGGAAATMGWWAGGRAARVGGQLERTTHSDRRTSLKCIPQQQGRATRSTAAHARPCAH